MKQRLFAFSALIVFILLCASCTPAAVTVTPEPVVEETTQPEPTEATEATEAIAPAAAEAESGPVVLTLVNGDQQLEFTLDELKSQTATSGQAGMLSSTGKITVPAEYTGVLLTDLLDLMGGITPDLGVNIVAEDGYTMTLSYDQVTNGGFITYDPSDGTEKEFDEQLRAMIAYAMDGQPMDAQRDGTLRMVVISSTNNQITDGHWAVKWVNRIEVQPVSKEWSLSLAGNREEVIDRNTFQSCGTSSCHQETWTDEEGQIWAGVPLYLLTGRVDDELKHEGPAYNRDLANAGYDIELVAADGYTTTLSSTDVYYDRQIMVAYLVNDAQLPDKYFPLRLVGADTEKGQRIGAITEIRLLMDEVNAMLGYEETAQPSDETPAANTEPAEVIIPEGTVLAITGQVTNTLYLSDTTVSAFPQVKLTLEHPKKGKGEYEGMYLNFVLDLAIPMEGAETLVFTASDGYSLSLPLADVRACTDCLLSKCEEGKLDMVMPGFESSAWLKDLVSIEVQ